MARRNRTFARQRACDGREVPKIACYFLAATRPFEFPHGLQKFCTRVGRLKILLFLYAEIRCKMDCSLSVGDPS
jgi:hypothetical protein